MPFIDLRSQSGSKSPEALRAHMRAFDLDLKFSAGIWFFSPPNSRFHTKYQKEIDIEARLEVAAGLSDYGLSGIEAHFPNEINEDNLDMWRGFSRDTGIRIITVIPLLFWDEQFEWGSLSNPLAGPRAEAIARTKAAFELSKPLICVEHPRLQCARILQIGCAVAPPGPMFLESLPLALVGMSANSLLGTSVSIRIAFSGTTGRARIGGPARASQLSRLSRALMPRGVHATPRPSRARSGLCIAR